MQFQGVERFKPLPLKNLGHVITSSVVFTSVIGNRMYTKLRMRM